MAHPLDSAAVDQLFLKARSHNLWQDREVPEALIHQLYQALRQGPTSNNCSPARFVFVRSPEAKQKLLPALKGHNGDKMLQAPVTVIVAWDSRFFELLPELFPIYDAGAAYRDNPQAAFTAALRNSSLQGAYLILAARTLGLDCGPMSGFDNAQVDATFFSDGRWRSNFLCCLGYGDDTGLRPSGPRLSFEQGCRIL
ncbi:putative NADH dehydrogenase/NAD(P)H nitroreductase [Metapseudomonas resinovorans]|uniref:malonic semialdehyde reductase n=1 Tax=Metapseudomonas resinovorans TaxID=53412 RepID=UPI0009854B45|nr:malonic semialdehyde reductase [Pseudomonas resinovorans]GLZ86972.1 putative NADH dehydrogenase/NAD(P)H nitroreductase [Pseudomonas resinovorans]